VWSVAFLAVATGGNPATAFAQQQTAEPLFHTADRCMACHNGLVTSTGEDISIGFSWRASMMGNSARDPYWMAAVRREVTDHPKASAVIQDECSKCHMPMMRFRAHAAGGEGKIFANLPPNLIDGGGAAADPAMWAASATVPHATDALGTQFATDGVSCTTCHQITGEKLGTRESLVGGFVIDTRTAWGERTVYGPFLVDPGRTTVMRSASEFVPQGGSHIQSSDMCATCHTLITHTLNERGEVIGELPEQVPYFEWLHSDHASERSCQSCHMPMVDEPVAVSSVLGQPRDEVSRHVFRGGNFFMPGILNRHRAELGVTALPQELASTVERTTHHLATHAARVTIERAELVDGRLIADVAIENLAGHKLPTAYPSRRAWLHVTVTDGYGNTLLESGALAADGSIEGNDNDTDPARFEPHHAEIDSPDQVQIYEAIMAGEDGALTTGLLTGLAYVKDNRLLPRGFDKSAASEEVAVHGAALEDEDFTASGDRVRYVIDMGETGGPYRIDVEVWYQPIGFRWAHNFAGYDAAEPQRFLSYYAEAAGSSAVVLAKAGVSIP
jgi:hypothetical protein